MCIRALKYETILLEEYKKFYVLILKTNKFISVIHSGGATLAQQRAHAKVLFVYYVWLNRLDLIINEILRTDSPFGIAAADPQRLTHDD